MGWLNIAYGRDFEPMAEIFCSFLQEFVILGYVHVLAQCAVLANMKQG